MTCKHLLVSVDIMILIIICVVTIYCFDYYISDAAIKDRAIRIIQRFMKKKIVKFFSWRRTFAEVDKAGHSRIRMLKLSGADEESYKSLYKSNSSVNLFNLINNSNNNVVSTDSIPVEKVDEVKKEPHQESPYREPLKRPDSAPNRGNKTNAINYQPRFNSESPTRPSTAPACDLNGAEPFDLFKSKFNTTADRNKLLVRSKSSTSAVITARNLIFQNSGEIASQQTNDSVESDSIQEPNFEAEICYFNDDSQNESSNHVDNTNSAKMLPSSHVRMIQHASKEKKKKESLDKIIARYYLFASNIYLLLL